MSGRSSPALKRRVQTLAAKGDDRMIELAEALAELWAMPQPLTAIGRPSTNLSTSRNSAAARSTTSSRFGKRSALGIPRDRLVRTGWTKLAAIAENLEAGAEEALALAETYTAKELPALLKGAPRKAKARTVLLRLTPRQYDQFEAVLLGNGARRPKRGRGLSGKEKALMKALAQ